MLCLGITVILLQMEYFIHFSVYELNRQEDLWCYCILQGMVCICREAHLGPNMFTGLNPTQIIFFFLICQYKQ